MKILLDVNLSPQWKETLLAASMEAILWTSVGRADAPDREIMDFAETYGYIVLTEDLDFGILLARNRRHGPSVAQLRLGQNLPRQVGSRVIAALKDAESELNKGALVSIDTSKERVSILPIG